MKSHIAGIGVGQAVAATILPCPEASICRTKVRRTGDKEAYESAIVLTEAESLSPQSAAVAGPSLWTLGAIFRKVFDSPGPT